MNENGDLMYLGPFDIENQIFSISLYGDRGLAHIDHIISLNYHLYDCDSFPSSTFLCLDLESNELLFFAKLKNYCSNKKSSTYQKLIFPDEGNGVKNGVVYYSEKKTLVDEKHISYKTYIYTRVYKWASGTLIEPIFEYYW